ncbi:hypothetical protein ASG31_05260 [Chryseobacterium sp. Leaf404]|uniref:hypothetical protein n=1 Tax=unclassified Chryseobacterium TaxID=2593645 RepID=UPI0006F538A8|nr:MULTISPECIES: hypothetical protein [unclassified Chryseobacterium]KQT18143.1 hypothetical protein ASG31_05260 [Chryseobacterium sp. Leaf404]
MTFDEALKQKKESVKNADESVLKLYHILITPDDTKESVNHIDYFLKNPERCTDESCKEFSSADEYQIVSIRKEDEDH